MGPGAAAAAAPAAARAPAPGHLKGTRRQPGGGDGGQVEGTAQTHITRGPSALDLFVSWSPEARGRTRHRVPSNSRKHPLLHPAPKYLCQPLSPLSTFQTRPGQTSAAAAPYVSSRAPRGRGGSGVPVWGGGRWSWSALLRAAPAGESLERRNESPAAAARTRCPGSPQSGILVKRSNRGPLLPSTHESF